MKRLSIVVLAFALFGGVLAAQRAENRLIDAVSSYNNGDFARSRAMLKILVQAEPGNDAAYYYLGLCEAALNQTDEAVVHLKRATELDPKNYWYRQRLADIYQLKGEYGLVIEMDEQLLKDFPDKIDIHYDLVNLYLQSQQYEKALASLDAVELVAGPSEQVTRMRYEILRTLHRDDEALAALEDFNRRYASVPILSTIGDFYLSEFRDSLALASYEEALGLQSDYVPALLGKSEVYRTRRQYPAYFETLRTFVGSPTVPAESKSMYLSNVTRSLDPAFVRRYLPEFDGLLEGALACHPADSTLLQTAGFYYYATNRKEEARGFFEKNVSSHPGSLSATASYVEALAYLEDWQTLKEQTEKAMGSFPEESAFLEYNSMAAYNLKDYETVIRNAETILQRHPGDSARALRAWSTIGDMQHSLGREKESFKAYDKALKINKDYAPVLNNYAWYLCQGGKRLKKAAQMSRKTIESEPDNATYLDTYGWILHLQGKDAEAKPVFKHAMLYGGKESPVMLAHYAEVLYKLKEYDLAKHYWMQAIKINNGEVVNLEEKVRKKLEAVGKW